MMDFYINFKLDEEFGETIESPIHENFSYSSFSEGEKMRVDLALLFTWREVARLKNSVNTNLLIMDEVFDSSLDGFGTEEFLKIIRMNVVYKRTSLFGGGHVTVLEVSQCLLSGTHGLRFQFSFLFFLRMVLPV